MASAQEIRPARIRNEWTGVSGHASDIRVYYGEDPEVKMAERVADLFATFREEGRSFGDIRSATRRALNALGLLECQRDLATAKAR